MASKRGVSFFCLTTLILTVSFTLPQVGLCQEDLIQNVINQINRTDLEMEKHGPIHSSSHVELTCSDSLSLLPSEQILWYDSSGKQLSKSSVENNTSKSLSYFNPKEGHGNNRTVEIKMTADKEYVYLYCVDPQTRNVVRGFQLEQHTWRQMYESESETVCALHDDFFTVLSCVDMFIPPTKVDYCDWNKTSGAKCNNKNCETTKSVMVLGAHDSASAQEEGTYECVCRPLGTDNQSLRARMKFVVKPATNERSLTSSFQFCHHLNKSHLNPAKQVSGTQKIISNETSTTTEPLPGVVVAFLCLGWISFLSLALVWAICERKRIRNRCTSAPDNRGQNAEEVPLDE